MYLQIVQNFESLKRNNQTEKKTDRLTDSNSMYKIARLIEI